MKIIVCMKAVPLWDMVDIDKEKNTISRSGIPLEINPFDKHAVEVGLQLKDKIGAKVLAFTMGPSDTRPVLRKMIAAGCDGAYLLSDQAFAGSDTLATAYVLAKAVEKAGRYDLILCGKQSADGGTGQVGPGLAEKLGIPHVTNVIEILSVKEGAVCCKILKTDWMELIEVPLPALLIMDKGINELRLPSLRRFVQIEEKDIISWDSRDLGTDEKLCGLAGSPTQVVNLYIPQNNKECVIFEGSPEEQAKHLAQVLSDY